MKHRLDQSRRKAIQNLLILGGATVSSKFGPLPKLRLLNVFLAEHRFPAPPLTISPTWLPVGPSPQFTGNTMVSGRVLCLATSPNFDGAGTAAIYLGCLGGIWRSSNFTTAVPVWTPLIDNLNLPVTSKINLLTINSIAIHPARPRVIYAAAGDAAVGVLKSADGGNSWQLLGEKTFSGEWPMSKIIIDPTDATGASLFVSGGKAGLYKSIDGGVSWQACVQGLPASFRTSDLDYTLSNTGKLTLYAGICFSGNNANGIYVSVDKGATWTILGMTLIDHATNMLVGRDKIGKITLAADHNVVAQPTVFAAINNVSTNFVLNVFKFVNAAFGVSVGNTLPGLYTQGTNMPIGLSLDGTLVIGSATAGVLRSVNQGKVWETMGAGSNGVSPHVDHFAFAFFNGAIYNGNDGGVWRYQPSAKNWESLNSPGLQTNLVNGISLHPQLPGVILIGSQDNQCAIRISGKWRTIDNGPGDGGVVMFDRETQGAGTSAYAWGPPDPNPNFFFRLDDFVSGKWVSKGFFNDNLVPFYSIFTINPSNPKHIFIPLGQLFESKDKGDTWKAISPVFNKKTSQPSAIACSADASVIYIGYGNMLQKTSNGGGTGTAADWSSISNSTAWSGISAIAVHPSDKSTAYVCSSNGIIWMTQSGGSTWTNITGNLPSLEITSIALRADSGDAQPTIFLGTAVGIWVSFAQSARTAWQRYGAGLPDIRVSNIEYNGMTKYLGAATMGRGVFVAYLHFISNLGVGASSVANTVFSVARDTDGSISVNQAEFGHAFSGWKTLPGSMRTDATPAIASLSNTLFVFSKGLDKKVYLNQADFGHAFGNWFELQGGGQTDVAVSATSVNNSVFVFMKDLQGRVLLNQAEFRKAFSGWFEVQGSGRTNVALAATSLNKSVFVFMRNLDGRILLNQAEFGHAFSGWFEVQGAGRTDTALAATTIGKSIFVFMKGLDGKVYLNQAEFGKAFSGWFEVQGGARTDAAPAATTVGNSVFVFIKGLDGLIYVNQAQFGSAFRQWFEVGGGL